MINRLDQQLITRLQQDGRLSYVALAGLLSVSERTVRNRLKHLLDNDVIKVSAVPNLEALGYGFIGMVGLQVRLADVRTIGRQLASHPNVCYLANVTGNYDFIAIIVARSTREFADFMENAISNIPSVVKTETFVSLNIYKGTSGTLDTAQLITALPLGSSRRSVKPRGGTI